MKRNLLFAFSAIAAVIAMLSVPASLRAEDALGNFTVRVQVPSHLNFGSDVYILFSDFILPAQKMVSKGDRWFEYSYTTEDEFMNVVLTSNPNDEWFDAMAKCDVMTVEAYNKDQCWQLYKNSDGLFAWDYANDCNQKDEVVGNVKLRFQVPTKFGWDKVYVAYRLEGSSTYKCELQTEVSDRWFEFKLNNLKQSTLEFRIINKNTTDEEEMDKIFLALKFDKDQLAKCYILNQGYYWDPNIYGLTETENCLTADDDDSDPGNVKVKVLVPDDAGWEASDKYLVWGDTYNYSLMGCKKLKDIGNSWWQGKIELYSSVNVSFYLTIKEVTKLEDAASECTGVKIQNFTDCYELNFTDGMFALHNTDCYTNNHNYLPKNFNVEISTGKAVYTWESEDEPKYWLVKEGEKDAVVCENREYIAYPNSKNDEQAPAIRVYAANEDKQAITKEVYYSPDKTIPAGLALGIQAGAVASGTIKFTWNKITGANHYKVTLKDKDNKQLEMVRTQNNEFTNSVWMEPLKTYQLSIVCYNKDLQELASEDFKFMMGDKRVLEEVTTKVLIPSACGFDVSKGVWALCTDNQAKQSVVKLSGSNGVYEFTYNCATPSFYFYLMDNEDKTQITQRSDDAKVTGEQCFEVLYQKVSKYGINCNQIIQVKDCSLADYDRKPRNLKATELSAGVVRLSWDADNSERFELQLYRKNSSNVEVLYTTQYPGEKYSDIVYGGSSAIEISSWTVRSISDDRVQKTPLSDWATGEAFTLKVSGYTPSNLDLKVNGTRCSFQWKVNGKGVHKCLLELANYNEGFFFGTVYQKIFESAEDMSELALYQTEEIQFMSDILSWRVYELDDNGNKLGCKRGEEFSVNASSTPLYKNLNVTTDDMKASLTWETDWEQETAVYITDEQGNTSEYFTQDKSLNISMTIIGQYSWKLSPASALLNGKHYTYNKSFSGSSFYLLPATSGGSDDNGGGGNDDNGGGKDDKDDGKDNDKDDDDGKSDDNALDDVRVPASDVQKTVENGVIYIYKNGKKYTTLGVQVQ